MKTLGSDPRRYCDISSPVTISAIKMTDSNEMEHDQSKVKKKQTVTDQSDPRDDVPDRQQFSCHPKDKIKMGDCDEFRPSNVVVDKVDTLETEREVSLPNLRLRATSKAKQT